MQGILPQNFQNISISAKKGHIIFALDPMGITHILVIFFQKRQKSQKILIVKKFVLLYFTKFQKNKRKLLSRIDALNNFHLYMGRYENQMLG